MNIEVYVNGIKCYWVDTVVMKDEIESVCAVLVNPIDGKVFVRDVNTIKVIDCLYTY